MSTAARAALVAVALIACGKGGGEPADQPAAPPPPPPAIDPLRTAVVTEVAASARALDAPAGPLVVATATALAVDGGSMAAITAGHVDALALDASQRRIEPLAAWAEGWSKTRPAGAWVRVAVAPTLAAAVVVQVIDSFAASGHRDFALIVRTPDGPGSLAVHPAEPLAPPADPDTSAVGMVLTRRPGADLDQQIAAARGDGAAVAIGGASGRGSRGDGDPRVATGGGPLAGTGSPGTVDAPSTPLGRITVRGGRAVDDSSLTLAAVQSKLLSAYLPSLKRCYRERLKVEPDARGTIALGFTVNDTGRVSPARAPSTIADVGSCVESHMAIWRFPIPKDVDGEPTTAAFHVDLQLVPD